MINQKISSLIKFNKLFFIKNNIQKDLKSWILNNYPINSYFKNILQPSTSGKDRKSKNIMVYCKKKEEENKVVVYLGEVSDGQKHGFGLEIVLRDRFNKEEGDEEDYDNY